jgi:hypothetical protein
MTSLPADFNAGYRLPKASATGLGCFMGTYEWSPKARPIRCLNTDTSPREQQAEGDGTRMRFFSPFVAYQLVLLIYQELTNEFVVLSSRLYGS